MALKPAQPKLEKKIEKPVEQKPVEQKPVEQKPVEQKPLDPNAPVVIDAAVPAEAAARDVTKKPEWDKFSAVAMSKIPVHTPMRGSVLNARIDVLKKPKPAPVADESDE